MAIQVLIRRRFIKEKEAVLAPLVVRLRSLALAQPGYISGETLKCIDPQRDSDSNPERHRRHHGGGDGIPPL